VVLGLFVLALGGCYVGVQRASWVTTTKAIDPEGGAPTSDLSISADIYEITSGVRSGGLDLFTGFGLGPQRVHQRVVGNASETDEIPVEDRMHIGAAFGLNVVGPVRLAVYGILAAPLTSLLFDNSDLEADGDLIESRIERSMEIGLEVSLAVETESDVTLSPILRIGIADQSGKVLQELYMNENGTTDFDGKAIMTTIGLNVGYGKGWLE